MPRWCTALACLGAALSIVAPADLRAQIGSGAVSGLVSDESGGLVADAVVTLVALDTGQTRVLTTGADGAYTIPGLVPGLYQIRVERPGFRPLTRAGVRVSTGETTQVDVTVTLGPVAEEVTIGPDASPARGLASGLGRVVDQQTVVSLPLNGRSMVVLATLVPGVALPPGSLLPRINGGRPRVNEYLFDGISVLQPEPGQVAYFPNIDAIQEFRIETNSPPAEFGRFNGGVINLTTKAGSNAVRGTAFEFLRHEALNARNFFAPTYASAPRVRRHQFGGVLGGPIRKDRSFFFVDYQGQRQTIGRTVISTVPTALQRQGIFTEPVGGRVPRIHDPATTDGLLRQPFPGHTIPIDRLDPVARALLARYPLPTSGGTANNYRRVGEETVDQEQISVRLDQQRGAGRDHVFGRLTRFVERFTPVTPLPDGSGAMAGTLGPQTTGAWALASGYRRVASPRVLHELRVGDRRRRVRRSAARLDDAASPALGLPGIPTGTRFADTMPTFVIAGYQQLGSPANTATDFATSVTQLTDVLTWLKGRHTAKFGADLRWQRLNVVQPPSPTGIFSFSSLFTDEPGVADSGSPLASFLLGQVQQFSIDLQEQPIRNRARTAELFAQDDWRVTDRLTVNAGVRYTVNVPSTEVNDQAAVFNLVTQELEYLGRDGRSRSARQLEKSNLGPRLGLASRIGERAIVRAAYAMIWIEQTGITTPFTTPSFPFLQTVTQRTLDNVTPAFVLSDGPRVAPIPLTSSAGLGQGVFAVDRDLGSGYVQQWNASFQRELPSGASFEAAYLGSTITRVGIPDSNLNQLTTDQLRRGPALLQRVPNPYFGVVPRSSSLGDPTIPVAQLLKPYPAYTTVSLYRNNVGTTSYHGFSAKLDRRFSRGLSYLVSYTRSKLVDDASSVFDASILTGPVANYPVADSFDRKRERDYSTGDIPHVLVSSASWDIPVGRLRRFHPPALLELLLGEWSLTGVLTLQSGSPMAVTQATNANAFAGFGVQRPNLVGNPTLPAAVRSPDRWFDTDAFSAAAPFTLGSASRNPVRGPGYRNLDLALIRRVRLFRGQALELRLEAFNVTNTPAFSQPNGVLGTAGFGAITSAGDPRVIQLAAKYVF